MSMSSDSVRAGDHGAGRGAGPWLALLMTQQIVWSLSRIIGEISWRAFLRMQVHNDTLRLGAWHSAADLAGSAMLLVYSLLHLLAALILLRRRWSSIKIALSLQVLASLLLVAVGLAILAFHPSLGLILDAPSDIWLLLPLACAAYFLSSSRIAVRYGRPAAASERAPWRGLLITLMLLPLIHAGYQVWIDATVSTVLRQANDAWLSGGLDAIVPPSVAAFLHHYLPLLLQALSLLVAALLLLWRRQWSTIPAVVVLLWLWPLYRCAETIRHFVGALPILSFGWRNGSAFGLSFLITATTNHLEAIISLGWVIAWSGYLLEAPAIHRYYPGRGHKEAVTDADVF